MYHNCFVFFLIFSIFPASSRAMCSKYYVLFEKYAFENITSLDLTSQPLNWNRYNINTNISEFNPECVIYLECKIKEIKCLSVATPVVTNSNDYVIDSSDYIDSIRNNPSKHTNITSTGERTYETIDMNETNVTESKVVIAPTAIIVNKTDNINNTTFYDTGAKIKVDLEKNEANSTKSNVVLSSFTNTTDKKTENESSTGLTSTKTSPTKSDSVSTLTTTQSKNITSNTSIIENSIGISENASIIIIDNEDHNANLSLSNSTEPTKSEVTTEIDKEIEILSGNKGEVYLNSNSTNRTMQVRLDESGNVMSQTNNQTSGSEFAGKIAAGIVGVGAAVVVVWLGKKHILECLQSGQYRVQEP